MTKYHISSTTGRPNQCRANKRVCPLGLETPHFETKDSALKWIEENAAENYNTVPTVMKSDRHETAQNDYQNEMDERLKQAETLQKVYPSIDDLPQYLSGSYSKDTHFLKTSKIKPGCEDCEDGELCSKCQRTRFSEVKINKDRFTRYIHNELASEEHQSHWDFIRSLRDDEVGSERRGEYSSPEGEESIKVMKDILEKHGVFDNRNYDVTINYTYRQGEYYQGELEGFTSKADWKGAIQEIEDLYQTGKNRKYV